MDEDGKETYCSLCGEGGSVVCCDSCEKTFCFNCMARISGNNFLKLLLDSSNEDEWLCYCCNPTPIASYQELAASLLQLLSIRKTQRQKTPKKSMSMPAFNSKEFVHASNSVESEREVSVIHQSRLTKITTPIKKGSSRTLSPRSNGSTTTTVNRFDKKMDLVKSNSVTSVQDQNRKRSIFSSSSDDGMRFHQHKRKRLSTSVTPQKICAMSDDSDFDLSSTPMAMKKATTPFSRRRGKKIMSESVCGEYRQQRGSQYRCKEKKSSPFVHSSDSSRTGHTLVSLDDTPKSTSSESSDSEEEVKSEEVSLSDDNVFEPVDSRKTQKHRSSRKHDVEETSDTSKPKNSVKKGLSLSYRNNRLGKSEYHPFSCDGESESGGSSVLGVDKAASGSVSSSRRLYKRRLSMLDSSSSVDTFDKRLSEKRKHCLADNLSSGSEMDGQVKKSSLKSLVDCLSSGNESEADTRTTKYVLGSSLVQSGVNGVSPLETQDMEYQVSWRSACASTAVAVIDSAVCVFVGNTGLVVVGF